MSNAKTKIKIKGAKMWRLIVDLTAGYIFYKGIKFVALNIYLPGIKEGIKNMLKNNDNVKNRKNVKF